MKLILVVNSKSKASVESLAITLVGLFSQTSLFMLSNEDDVLECGEFVLSIVGFKIV